MTSVPILHSPLTIHVIWHPAFAEGEQYARFLYGAFNRNPDDPFDRGTGVPVFFRSVPTGTGLPLPIDLAEADRNVIVLLLDDELVAADGDQWEDYVHRVLAECRARGPLHQLIPVAISDSGFNFSPEVSRLNGIRLNAIRSQAASGPSDVSDVFEQRCVKLRGDLLNELTRLMLPSAATSLTTTQPAPPVKLFLSHARNDGAEIAADVRQYIRATTSLDSFFDVTNIAFGYDFAEAIETNVEASALIVFQTDLYASRDWCQMEALTAKIHKCPIVVVNALEKGEKRSFPYLGNVPTVRWNKGGEANVLAAAMDQVLKNLYTTCLLKKIAALYGHPERYVLASPPELLDFVEIRRAMKEQAEEDCVVMYPDPPLGNREIILLTDSDARLLFITPTQLPILKALTRV